MGMKRIGNRKVADFCTQGKFNFLKTAFVLGKRKKMCYNDKELSIVERRVLL